MRWAAHWLNEPRFAQWILEMLKLLPVIANDIAYSRPGHYFQLYSVWVFEVDSIVIRSIFWVDAGLTDYDAQFS